MSSQTRENGDVTDAPRQRSTLGSAGPTGSGRASAAGRLGDIGRVGAVVRWAFRAPFSARARRELTFCLIGVAFGLAVLAAPFTIVGLGTAISLLLPRPDHQPAVNASLLVVIP